MTRMGACKRWQKMVRDVLTPDTPFDIHLDIFSHCYPGWEEDPEIAIAWSPDEHTLATVALKKCMEKAGCTSVAEFHAWSVREPDAFWKMLLAKIPFRFEKTPDIICDRQAGAEQTVWLKGARFNIAESCLTANPDKIAITEQNRDGLIVQHTYGQLEKRVRQIAGGLRQRGCVPGDAIALVLPMHFEAVACYLGILYMGGIAVSIAESFAPAEIRKRLEIAGAVWVITQETFERSGKCLPLASHVRAAGAQEVILLPDATALPVFSDALPLQGAWMADPGTHCTILFSSGTTGIPKAIPWTHATPFKAAADALLHFSLGQKDIICWPTSLGWMMGPWLVFAGLIHQSTLALYTDSPLTRSFAEFVHTADVTVLGVIPTLVAHWRDSSCLTGTDWSQIRLFASTGECSSQTDMLYLMSRADYCPVIEYCGGTEVGGAYITSTLLQDNCPSLFTTPAMGSRFVFLDEENGRGEIALVPPALGMSAELLNADHHATYYADMPSLPDGTRLRRHGDYAERLPNGYFRLLGRCDDTMNLGGIKTGSAEIERILAEIPFIREVAAVASTSETAGPAQLLIYAVLSAEAEQNPGNLKNIFQKQISICLNPLFRVARVIVADHLPRTPSGKISRRMLKYDVFRDGTLNPDKLHGREPL